MRHFRITGFERLQHYKNRTDMGTPAWIKLYRSKLHDFTFRQLPDACKAHLILIELLASQSGNKLPCDPKQIQSAIGADKSIDLDLLLSKGFIELVDEPSALLLHLFLLLLTLIRRKLIEKPQFLCQMGSR